MPLRVVCIDDSRMVLAALSDFLSQHSKVTLVGTAEGGVKGLEMAEQHELDVVTVDLSMPDIHGLEVIRRLRESLPDLGIIAVTSLDPLEQEQAVVDAGADGFVDKALVTSELMPAILEAARKRGRYQADASESDTFIDDSLQDFLDAP